MTSAKTLLKLLVTGAFTVSLLAADSDLDTVRAVFLSADRPTVLGMRFDVVLEGADGSSGEVPVSHNFHSGDRFWLKMDVRTSSWVYVINRTIPGEEKGIVLVRESDLTHRPPSSELPRLVFGPQKAVAGAKRLFPEGKNAMAFDDQTGAETLYVILSDHPLELERLFDHSGLANESRLSELNDNLVRWSRNATVAVPVEGAKGFVLTDSNAYCVQKQQTEPLMIEISLRHSN